MASCQYIPKAAHEDRLDEWQKKSSVFSRLGMGKSRMGLLAMTETRPIKELHWRVW